MMTTGLNKTERPEEFPPIREMHERAEKALHAHLCGEKWPEDVWWTAPVDCAMCERTIMIQPGGLLMDKEIVKEAIAAGRKRKQVCHACCRKMSAAGWSPRECVNDDDE